MYLIYCPRLFVHLESTCVATKATTNSTTNSLVAETLQHTTYYGIGLIES